MRLVLALILGVAIGFVLGLSVTKAPRPTRDDGAVPRGRPSLTVEEPAARLAGRGPSTPTSAPATGAATIDRRPVAESPVDAAGPPPARDPHTVAWLDVRVPLPSGGTRLAGTVYALPAGHPGVDETALLSHADLEGEHARLPLPAGGLWDVGYAGPLGHVLRRDVHVAAGETTVVDLRLPPLAPVTAVFESPEAASWAVGRKLHVRVRALHAGRERDFPGRGDEYRWRTSCHLDGKGPARTRPLPLGKALHLQLLWGTPPAGKAHPIADARPHPDWRLELNRSSAVPGDQVGVGLVQLAQVLVTPRVEGQASRSWPDGTGFHAWIGLRREGQVVDDAIAAVWRGAQGELPQIALRAKEGSASLSWKGDFCFPGRVDDLHLVAGEVKEVEALIRLDPDFDFEVRSVPTTEPLRIHLEGAHSTHPGAELLLYAADALDLGDVLAGDVRIVNEGDQVEEDEALVTLPGSKWKGVEFLAAAHGPDRVARAARIDAATGEVVLRLESAGYLLACPAWWPSERLGRVFLRRQDGKPVLTSFWDPGEVSPQVRGPEVLLPAEPCTLLGPLAPGRYVFDVLLGTTRVGEASATVHAGRIEILRLPR